MILLTHSFLHATRSHNQPAYRVEGQWNLGGEGGWGNLRIDSSAHLLYIPRTDRLMAVDTNTGREAGEVKGMIDARDVALGANGKYGYVTDVTNGTRGVVRVFDRSTFRIVASVDTGLDPDALVIEPVTGTLFVFHAHAHSATLIDALSNQVTGTVALPGRGSAALADGKGGVFVTVPVSGSGAGQILLLNAASRKVAAAWSTGSCLGPTGLAIDSAHRRLFSACENRRIVAVDMQTGRVLNIGEIGLGPGDISFDPQRGLLFCADSSGALTIFHQDSTDSYSVEQRLNTLPGARTLVRESAKDRVYLVTSKFGPRLGDVSEELRFRPAPIPGSFSVIAVGR